MNEPGETSWEENPFAEQHRYVRRIRTFDLGAKLPERATFLGMHIEMRNDGLRTTPTPVFFYEVTEPP